MFPALAIAHHYDDHLIAGANYQAKATAFAEAHKVSPGRQLSLGFCDTEELAALILEDWDRNGMLIHDRPYTGTEMRWNQKDEIWNIYCSQHGYISNALSDGIAIRKVEAHDLTHHPVFTGHTN